MSISWIILGILALGVLGILAIYFFYVLEESYAKVVLAKSFSKE